MMISVQPFRWFSIYGKYNRPSAVIGMHPRCKMGLSKTVQRLTGLRLFFLKPATDSCILKTVEFGAAVPATELFRRIALTLNARTQPGHETVASVRCIPVEKTLC
jgi:hypothetical protein